MKYKQVLPISSHVWNLGEEVKANEVIGDREGKEKGDTEDRRVEIKTHYMHVWAYYNMKINCKKI